MTIDIISYTDEQFASLTLEQLKEVREAQTQKDKLSAALEEELQEAKDSLVRKGIFNSSIFSLMQSKLQAEYAQKVELIRDGLQFYLKYSMQPDGSTWDAPYPINFALSYEARFNVVREYYENTYTDAGERFAAFEQDKFALRYLGELYKSLYGYFKGLATAQTEESG